MDGQGEFDPLRWSDLGRIFDPQRRSEPGGSEFTTFNMFRDVVITKCSIGTKKLNFGYSYVHIVNESKDAFADYVVVIAEMN